MDPSNVVFPFLLIFILKLDTIVHMAPRNDQYVADLKILVDVSYSVTDDEIEAVKLVLLKIVNRLHISNTMGVQLFKFSKQFNSILHSPYRTIDNFSNLNDDIKDIKGPELDELMGTMISRMLKFIKFSSDKGLPVILLFTDGYFDPDDINGVKSEIDRLKMFKPEIFVFPYSISFNRNNLEMFCGENCENHLLPLKDYTKIYEYLNHITRESFEMNMFSYIDFNPTKI